MRFGRCLSTVPALMLATAACDQSIAGPAPADIRPAQDIQAPGGEVGFNPQPEPPAMLVSFEIAGPIEGSLRGEYEIRGGRGALMVETLSSRGTGAVLHIRQRWTVHPPEPVIPPDGLQPVVLELHGILQRGGLLVLSGSDLLGGRAHARAVVTAGTDGISIGVGELMFNPQPEPPAMTLSANLRAAMTTTLTAALAETGVQPDAAMGALHEFFNEIDARQATEPGARQLVRASNQED